MLGVRAAQNPVSEGGFVPHLRTSIHFAVNPDAQRAHCWHGTVPDQTASLPSTDGHAAGRRPNANEDVTGGEFGDVECSNVDPVWVHA